MASQNNKNVALVYGASGISGWAITNCLFTYPTPDTFSRIIGLTNRPFDRRNSALPVEDPRLELYHGIDLKKDSQTVKAGLSKTVPRLHEVTHVYYCAYTNVSVYSQDMMASRDINVHMTRNAVAAVDALCSNLKHFVLQTGSNYYGVAVFSYQDKIEILPPLKESQPRIPAPYGNEILYYGQVDAIKEINQNKSWRWCEVRPDAIVGFVPAITSMTFLEPVALFLSLWRYINGPGSEVGFIGTAANYGHTNTDSSQDIVAKAEIYLSLSPEAITSNGEAFNVADYDTPTSSVEKWPIMANYFGLKGIPPAEDAHTAFPADQWWINHQDDYKRMCAEHGLQERTIPPETWTFTSLFCYSLLCRNRSLCLDKIRAAGFKEELPIGKGHYVGFDRMVAAKIIPHPSAM